MRKSGLKKSSFAILLSFFAAFLFVLFGAGCSSDKERIQIDFTEQVGCLYDSSTQTVTIEYGATFILPDATVVDKNGNELDYAVEYKLYDGKGEELAVTSIVLNLNRGDYSLIYSASESKAKELVLKLSVIDEAAPAVTITSMFINAGSVGDTIYLPTFRVQDISGVNQSATKERVTFNGSEVALDNRSFKAELEGFYLYELSVEDNLGNAETKVIPVTITERYADTSIAGKQMMTFDNADYERNILKLYDSTEGTSSGIVVSGIPEAENGITPSGGAYKLVAPDNSKTSFLVRNNKEINSDGDSVGNIVFRVYTDELVERLQIISPDGKREYAQFKYIMPGWSELAVNAHSAVGWYDDFGDFLLIIENEDAVNFYLDEIFYTEQWKDSEREANVLADFDEAGYFELVENNHFSKTAKLEILTQADKEALNKKEEAELSDEEKKDKEALENAEGGVLKVTANSSFDGFKVTFAKPVDVNEIVGVNVRMYFPELYRGSEYFSTRFNFISNDGFIAEPIWGDVYNDLNLVGGYVSGWKDYWHAGPWIKSSFTMAESPLAVGYYFAFVLDGTAGCTFYIDEISVVLKSGTISNDVPAEAGDEDGLLADFTREEYAGNVIPASDKGVSYSYSANPDFYGYGTFNDGETDAEGLKVVHGNGVWSNGSSNFYYYEGIEYILPQAITIRNPDNTPRAGEIVLKAWFEASDYVVVGVANGVGTHSQCANQVTPRRTYEARAGWNEFRISVKGLINEGIYDISSVYMLSLNPGTWYLTDIGYTEYIPPYNDPSFMSETEKGYYLLADFDEDNYMTSLSVSGYGSSAPAGIAVKNVTLDGADYGVLELKPSSAGNNGFDLLFPRSIVLSSRKNIAANYIYFKVYTPVALESAGINLATINLGQYSVWGHYVTPKRVTYKLEAGWNIIRLDVKQLAEEGITEIEGLAFTADPVWPVGTAEKDKVLYIDTVYMDTEYDASRTIVVLETPRLSAVLEGSSLTFSWEEVENAASYAVRVNDGEEIEVKTCSYTLRGFDKNKDLRFTVIARRTGSVDSSASWFYDRRFDTYDESLGGMVLAKFDKTGYNGTFSQVGVALADRKNTLSDFQATTGGMKISTYGYDKLRLSGGFTYRLPFAADNVRAQSLTFKLSYVSGLENGWSIGHASEAFFGLIDTNGVMYNAVKYSSVDSSAANTIRNDDYYEKYNNPNPTFVIDLAAMRAENPQMGNIAALYFSHNKSVAFHINYIVYDNGKTALEAPVLTLTGGENGYVVSWTEIPGAVGYEVKFDGEPIDIADACSVTLTETGIITVKALGGGIYNDSKEASLFADGSYMAEKGDGYYWLSNFDDARSEALIGGISGDSAAYGYTSEMTGANLDIETKGITLASTGGGSVKYTLLNEFDLSGISNIEFVLRQNANKDRGNAFSITFTLGDKSVNITPKMHNVGKAEGSQTLWSGMLGNSTISTAYNCVNAGIDIQKHMDYIVDALGGSAIDGMIIWVQTKDNDYYILDEISYDRITLSTPVGLRYERTEEGYKISWDEVENAESYEVLINGSPANDYTGGTSFTTDTVGLITVRAKSSTALDGEPASLFIDPSFGAERGDGYYWLSNFDGSGTAAMFEGSGVSWNGGACGAATYEYTSQNTGSNKDIETKGISIRMPGTYGSVKYNLPENFDLSGVQSLEFVLRQNGNATRGNAVSLMLTCGDKIYTISGKMTNVKKAEGAGDLWSSMLGNPLSFGINCAHVGFDVQKYLTDIEETLGGTVIDGIIICVNTKAQNADGTYDVVILDEIFYSKVSVVTDSEAESAGEE